MEVTYVLVVATCVNATYNIHRISNREFKTRENPRSEPKNSLKIPFAILKMK